MRLKSIARQKAGAALLCLLPVAILATSGASRALAQTAASQTPGGTKQSHLLAGIAAYQKRDYQGAATALTEASKATPSATASYYLALCYEQLHYHAQAVDLFNRLATTWPNSSEAAMAKTYLHKLAEINSATASSAPAPGATANSVNPADSQKPKPPEHISQAEWEKLPNKCRVLIAREHGHLMVTAKVNGQYGKFAFDTGATYCGVGLLDYPNMFTQEQLAQAKRIPIARPHGAELCWEMTADITLQDITRRCKLLVLPEKDVCVIGQNFFKEYSYQIDDFYIRLTKAPYQGDQAVAAGATGATGATGAAGAAGSAAGALATVSKTKAISTDRYTIPFELDHDTMLIDIVVNGTPTKATFDTGCAPDGIVCHPTFAEKSGMDHPNSRGNRANRLVIGSIIRMDVPVYYASGLRYPLCGPKIFNRPYTVDPINKVIKFDY